MFAKETEEVDTGQDRSRSQGEEESELSTSRRITRRPHLRLHPPKTMTNHYSCFMGDDIINTLSLYCDESCCGCIVLNSACVVLTRLLSPPRAPTAVTPRLEVGRVTRRGFCTVQCNRLRETACQNQSLKQL